MSEPKAGAGGSIRTVIDRRAASRLDYPYAFAEDHDSASDLAADLPALRDEVAVLEAAGVRSPAAMYAVPDQTLGCLDEAGRESVRLSR